MPEPNSLPFSFDAMLTRMVNRDHTADGLFITGVRTTGIYCLPSCPARKPKAENVDFYTTEEEAQEAGLRPCLRCHPDRFYARQDPDKESLLAALAALDQDPTAFPNVTSLAERTALGSSKLYAVAQRCTGTTPGELIHQRRVHIAMGLLREGKVGATEAAFAVGYGSVSAFYERFKKATGLTPKEFAQRKSC